MGIKRPDLIVICGHPRSGTSFVHNVFAEYGMDAGVYALHDQLDESRTDDWRTSEPPVFDRCYNENRSVTGLFSSFLRRWRERIGDPVLTIVYKHPQAVFFAPFRVPGLDVRYVICTRSRDTWLKSALAHDDTVLSVGPEMNLGWIKSNWGVDWNWPVSIEDRLLYLYGIFSVANRMLSNAVPEALWFRFEEPFESLRAIWEPMGLGLKAREAFDEHWWSK